MHKITIHFNELYLPLVLDAQRKGVEVSALVRTVVADYLKKPPPVVTRGVKPRKKSTKKGM